MSGKEIDKTAGKSTACSTLKKKSMTLIKLCNPSILSQN